MVYDIFEKNKYYKLKSISRFLNKNEIVFTKKDNLLICSELNDKIISLYNIEDNEIYNILINKISRINVYFSTKEEKRCTMEGGYNYFVDNDNSITRLVISFLEEV